MAEMDDNDFNADGFDDSEAEELKRQILEIQKKLSGENSESVTNNEILIFLRVVNYNFVSLTQLLQAILLKTSEMDTVLMDLGVSTSHLEVQLKQFFESNSMLNEIMGEGESNFVSGSAPNNSGSV